MNWHSIMRFQTVWIQFLLTYLRSRGKRERKYFYLLVNFLNAQNGQVSSGAEARNVEFDLSIPCGWQKHNHLSCHQYLVGVTLAGDEKQELEPVVQSNRTLQNGMRHLNWSLNCEARFLSPNLSEFKPSLDLPLPSQPPFSHCWSGKKHLQDNAWRGLNELTIWNFEISDS